ncbi:MAG: acetate/propionate family kinase [Bacteroidetes bacterium]|nr:acetate/propionate family kinase [Bacteroidota bacterium]
MNILVLNCGSSSIKAAIIDSHSGYRLSSLRVERIPEDPQIILEGKDRALPCKKGNMDCILTDALEVLQNAAGPGALMGVGHRVVHGGESFDEPVVIDQAVEDAIEACSPLAPLHNPVNLQGIRTAKKVYPAIPHVAVFDTAFHQTIPHRAQRYAIDKDMAEKHGIRRYGFHGTSHEFVAGRAAKYLQADVRDLRIITCHLGNGCSMAAVEYGRSVETSMGMTPLEGLVMGSRSGDVDPGVLIHLMKKESWTPDELDQFLNNQSGLKGLSGVGNDMRDIIERSSKGDVDCRMALNVFSHQVRKYIGAYAAVMGGVDAIVFTGGIGENSAVVRHRVCQRLDYLGALLNEDLNRDVSLSSQDTVVDFSMRHSRVRLLAVATDEQLAISRETAKLIQRKDKVNVDLSIPIAISARHVHLTQETVELLFGKGHELSAYKPLSQPGQFASNERLTIVGPKNRIERVRILGPVRSRNQVEISRTDEFFLGIDAPVRQSGHTAQSPGCTLVGPKGKVELHEGVICAWRHIHMTPEDAKRFEVADKDIVEVEVKTVERSLTFGNVMIRVSPKYKLEMHIDTDEGNAAELSRGAEGTLVETDGQAVLKKKSVHFVS